MTRPKHPPMSQWTIADDCLFVGGMPLSRLAQRAGRTPFYAYDRQLITDRVTSLRNRLPAVIRIHFAVKANPMPALVCHMARLVDGMDVASSGELKISLDSGMTPANISFAGPGKTASELSQAVAAGALVNIESSREIELLARASAECGIPARVGVRINPDFELKVGGMRMGGGAKQFGIDVERVPDILRQIARAGLLFEGFHVFAGSQILNATALCDAQRQTVDLVLRLSDAVPAPIRTLNIGGGFGIPYFPGERPLEIAPISETLRELHERIVSRLPEASLVLELGRYLVGEAGIYVAKVIERKISRGQVFLITDGGMHQHLAASGNLGQIVRKNFPVAVANRVSGGNREIASVVGPLCTPLDVLADRAELSEAHEGDLIVVFQSGAYGLSASPVAFLSHPGPLEMFV